MPEELKLILCILGITLMIVQNRTKQNQKYVYYRKTNQSYKSKKHHNIKSKSSKRKNTPQSEESYIDACWEEIRKH